MKRLINRRPSWLTALLLGLIPFFIIGMIYISHSDARLLENPDDRLLPSADGPGTAGRHRIAVEVPDLQLYPGRYWLRLALTQTATGRQHDLDRIGFQVEQDFTLCTRPLPRQAGLVYRRAEWTVLSPPSP